MKTLPQSLLFIVRTALKDGRPFRRLTTTGVSAADIAASTVINGEQRLQGEDLAFYANQLTGSFGFTSAADGSRVTMQNLFDPSHATIDLNILLTARQAVMAALDAFGIRTDALDLGNSQIDELDTIDQTAMMEQGADQSLEPASKGTPASDTSLASVATDLNTLCRNLGRTKARGGKIALELLHQAIDHVLELNDSDRYYLRFHGREWEAGNHMPVALYRGLEDSTEIWLFAERNGELRANIFGRMSETDRRAAVFRPEEFLGPNGWTIRRDWSYRTPGYARGWNEDSMVPTGVMPTNPLWDENRLEYWKMHLYAFNQAPFAEMKASREEPFADRPPFLRLSSTDEKVEILVSGCIDDDLVGLARTPQGVRYGKILIANLYEDVVLGRSPLIYHDTAWRSDGRAIHALAREAGASFE